MKLKPYLMQKNLNFLHSQAAGMQKLQARMIAPEPPGETFTSYFCYNLLKEKQNSYQATYFNRMF